MNRLTGVIPPLITPFTREDRVDEDALRAIVRFLTPHVHGLFVCGTYGAGPLMNVEERQRVLEVVLEEAAGLTVTVHVGATNLRDALLLARHAASSGAALVASLPPYYYHHPENEVAMFFRSLVEAVAIPVYVYNNPKTVGYGISPAFLRTLAGHGVRGVKDSSFDILVLANYLRKTRDLDCDVVLGTEAMFTAASALGIQAFIPGLGNAFPELCRTLFETVQRAHPAAARAIQDRVNAVREVMYEAGSTMVAVFAMLELRGICRAYPRPPFLPLEPPVLDSMRQKLAALEVL
jgi:dihydrodipicolinate synthase/N-acetylneuraminate lyase